MYFYLIFIAVNLFIGLCLGFNAWAAFGQIIHNRIIFWLIVLVFTQSYWIIRFAAHTYNLEIPGTLYFIVTSLFALCIVALLTVICADIVLLLTWLIKPLKPFYLFIKTHSVHAGVAVTASVLLYCAAGFFIANSVRETHYKISVNKPLSVESIKIVMVSDLHITTFTRTGAVKNLIEIINRMNADLVLFAGDIVDMKLDSYTEKGLSGYFSQIRSGHGVYMIMGNHEYYGGHAEDIVKEFTSAGIRILRDEIVFLEPLGITLIGRDDLAVANFKSGPRAALKDIMNHVDISKPVVVLDHQPQNRVIKETAANGVDLQLSGHTHNGQFFPFNLIVKKIYINAWKLWTDGAYHLIVSCGFGTWGPPIRTASYSEIVVVELTGK